MIPAVGTDAYAEWRATGKVPVRMSQKVYSKWPWRTLGVGESFVMPDVTRNSAAAKDSAAGKRFGRKFSTAIVENGISVRRVK